GPAPASASLPRGSGEVRLTLDCSTAKYSISDSTAASSYFSNSEVSNTSGPHQHAAIWRRMLQMNYRGIAILCLWVLSPLAAQAGPHKPSPASAVVASSGSYQLTEQMIEQALRFGQILAGSDFSASDAAALRGDLIATFEKEPAKQIEAYEAVAKA